MLFVRSCKPMLQEFTCNLAQGRIDSLSYSTFNDIMHFLELIMNFLFDVSDTKAIFYEDYREEPVPYRQKVLKDFKILEILTDLIYLCSRQFSGIEINPSSQFWLDRISSIIE